ncbi:MAG: Ig-like domain-containing protein [Lachnospiraceae bacterium]
MDCKESATRKLALLMAVLLIIIGILEYGALMTFADDTGEGVISGLKAELNNDDVVLYWNYATEPQVAGILKEYQLYLNDGTTERLLSSGSYNVLSNTFTVIAGRTIDATYTITVKAVCEVEDMTGTSDDNSSVSDEEAADPVSLVEETTVVGTASVTWNATYLLTFNVGENGKVVFDGNEYDVEDMGKTVYAVPASSPTFAIEAETGYIIDFATPAGVSQTGEETYSLSGIVADTVISVSFYRKLTTPVYNATVTLGESKETAAMVVSGESITLSVAEMDAKIQYQFVDSTTEVIDDDGWIVYNNETVLNLIDAYEIGVLKVKAVPTGGDGTLVESDVATWYYTTIPENEAGWNFGMINIDTGHESDLSASNWIITSDDKYIYLKNIAQSDGVKQGDYTYMLCLEEQSTAQQTLYELVWLDTQNAYVFEIPDGLNDGLYNIGYTIKNRKGILRNVVFTSGVLAVDNETPDLVWKEISGALVEKQDVSGSYFANGDLVIKFGNNSSVPISGIAGYQYRIAQGEWQNVTGDSVTIPLLQIETDTSISFKVISNSGLEKQESILVTKDITPPGGEDGTTVGEVICALAVPQLENKNPANESISSVDTSAENTIYYDADETEIKFVLKAVNEREASSGSYLFVKYTVQKYGMTWTREEANTLTAQSDGTYIVTDTELVELKNEGKYVVSFWLEDEVGNYSQPVSYVMCYDNTAPVVVSQTDLSGTLISGGRNHSLFANSAVQIQLTVKEPASGICKIEFYNTVNGTELLYTCDTYKGKIDANGTPISYTVSEPGEYSIVARIYDMAGNCQEASWAQQAFILDNSEPSVIINAGGADRQWVNGPVNVQITAVDNEVGIASINYSINGNTTTVEANGSHTFTYSFEVLEEAETSEGYTLEVTAINSAGLSYSTSAKIFIDNTSPTVWLSGVTPAQLYQEGVSLNVNINENIYTLAKADVTVQRILDGVTSTYLVDNFSLTGENTTKGYSFTLDGEYVVTVEAQDAAGNSSGIQKISFTIDQTAPIVNINGIQDGEYYNIDPVMEVEVIESLYANTDVTILVRRTIDGTTTEYPIAGMTLYAKSSIKTYTFTEEGTYFVEVRAVDEAGNSAMIQKVSFSVDKTIPVLTIGGFDNHIVTDGKINAEFNVEDLFYQGMTVKAVIRKTDMEGNVTETEVHFGTISRKNNSVSQELTEDGKYKLIFEVTDIAGNVNHIEKDFIIDTQPPEIRYLNEYDSKYFQKFQLRHSLEEMIYDYTLSDYELLLNGLPYNGIDSIVEEGKYLLEIWVKDEVGHETSAKAEFIVDNTAPMIIISGAEDGMVSYEPITFKILLKDNQDTITSIVINGEQQNLTEDIQQTFSFTEYGEYKVEVTANDYAGNEEISVFTVVYREETIFSKWFSNKPLFYISIAGLSLGGGIATYLSAFARKKK